MSSGVGARSVFYARHRLELSLNDILFGVRSCCRPWRWDRLEAEVLGLCSLERERLACYSVRSGWDLWLGTQSLRDGDEVLVSAVTHPDMVRIIRGYGLRAVPVDIEPDTLAPRLRTLEAALTSRTRVLLVAHLFGGRMDLGPISRFAREHGLILVEDCAQAFQGPERVGDPAAEVSMYSFGTLKTSTALGGAVLRVRDRGVLRKMREAQADYPVQRRGVYIRKLFGALGLVVVSWPRFYWLLVLACAWLGVDLDALVNRSVRAFPPQEDDVIFFRHLRRRPSSPLLAMLSRRLSAFDRGRLARRAAAGERFASRLGAAEVHPGGRSVCRTHWLSPVVVPDPESLVFDLRKRGLDASQATTSIAVVEASDGHSPPSQAHRMMSGIVFLPVHPSLPSHVSDAMVDLVNHRTARKAVGEVALN